MCPRSDAKTLQRLESFRRGRTTFGAVLMTLTLHDWPDLPDENGRYVCKACGQTTECCSALCSQKKVLEVLHENIENLADSVSDRFVTSMKDELRRLREKSALDTPNKADQKCKRQV